MIARIELSFGIRKRVYRVKQMIRVRKCWVLRLVIVDAGGATANPRKASAHPFGELTGNTLSIASLRDDKTGSKKALAKLGSAVGENRRSLDVKHGFAFAWRDRVPLLRGEETIDKFSVCGPAYDWS
jgi:hypothetical protein